MEHPAKVYNAIKEELFSIYNGKGTAEAFRFLNSKTNALPVSAWIGLKAEMQFYDKYKGQFMLDPLLDFGIKADFTGNFYGCPNCRIDVTTNIEYKRLADYFPIQKKDGRKYKIAIMDHKKGELIDVVDLNFPYDDQLKGWWFDLALFMPADVDKDGCSKYNYYQQIVSFNSACPDVSFKLKELLTDWYIPDIHTEMQDMWDAHEDDEEYEIKVDLKRELADTAKFIQKVTGHQIVACAQRNYQIYDPRDGDGDYITQIYWRHPVVMDELDEIIEADIASEL